MRILHYSLGFPPYRTGGLTKFNYDLMIEQVREFHSVSLLWPGEMKLAIHKTSIKKHKSVNGINNYEIVNALPISYDEGIVNVDSFITIGDIEIYRNFLDMLQPEIIHIHTLMGLHKNLLLAAKEKKIRLVFTTHDFFPICPKVTMFRNDDVCKTIDTYTFCPQCNMTALSMTKMQILQSPAYRELKDSYLIKKLRKIQRDEYLSDNLISEEKPKNTAYDYKKLRQHYKSMLDMMDIIHYNSRLTKAVYERHMGNFPGKVLSITHANISDHREIKKYNHKILRLTYLGPQGKAKGFFYLKEVLDNLWKDRQDFYLNVFFHNPTLPSYIRQHDRYNYNQLELIMRHTDVVITPSIWYETFGYTVLEALSYGVPVIISKNVGAKDIVPEGGGIITENKYLSEVIEQLNFEQLESMNQVIINKMQILTIDKFNQYLIEDFYK